MAQLSTKVKLYLEANSKTWDAEKSKIILQNDTGTDYIEISYDELEKNPIDTLNEIYTALNIDNYDIALKNFEAYVDKLKSYKKNRHKIKKSQLDLLIKEWGFTMEKYNYSIPNSIEIVD